MKSKILCTALIAAFLFTGCGTSTETEEVIDLSKGYTAGTYTGEGKGYNGTITVETVFDENSIVSVTVLEHSDTPSISGMAVTSVPDAIVENQTFEIDGQSGATKTSNGIKDAVKDCVIQAQADK